MAASCIVAIVLLFTIGAAGGLAGAGTNWIAWIRYYSRTLSGSLAGFLYDTVLFFCLTIIMLVIWSLGKSFLAIIFPSLRGDNNKEDDPRKAFLAAALRSRDVWLIIPAILFITLAALVMGEANMMAPPRLQDQAVISIEHALFGNYVFAALGAIHYPHPLIVFIIWSFGNMALILIGAGIIIAYLAPSRFRELIVAFSIGILLMIPLWIMVPVLSPQDRYIDNRYNLPMSSSLVFAVKNYHPQVEIADFLSSVRTDKQGLPALPTSTFPSAHVFWASIAAYYLFKTKKWLGWISLPLLLASTFGTVLLAQHYFLDVPAGMAIAALAIWAAHRVDKPETRY